MVEDGADLGYRSSVPLHADVHDTLPPRKVRRVRYRANEVQRGWTSTIDLELPTTSVSGLDLAGRAANREVIGAQPVTRQTYRRSWHVMCPNRCVVSFVLDSSSR